MFSYDRDRNSHDRSRDRSKDRRAHRSRSSSQESRRRHRSAKEATRPKSRRVKFEETADVRVFRKEDEPIAKGLSDEELNELRAKIEKQIARSYDFNWDQKKHNDALSEGNSMKEQKEKEKVLNDKLMAVKESIGFYCAWGLRGIETGAGIESLERVGHEQRLASSNTLGCYYTNASLIPNEPQFQIINTLTTNQSKIIQFDRQTYAQQYQTLSRDNPELTLKGILKLPHSAKEGRLIDPILITLLKDISANPALYPKERIDVLLKPYKDSGELQYLKNNRKIVDEMLKNSTRPRAQFPQQLPNARESAARESTQRESASRDIPAPAFQQPNFVNTMRADKFKTVPCKYYHSHQGCSKTDNCTFIHNEKYAGQPVPSSYPSNFVPGAYPGYIPPTSTPYPLPMPYPNGYYPMGFENRPNPAYNPPMPGNMNINGNPMFASRMPPGMPMGQPNMNQNVPSNMQQNMGNMPSNMGNMPSNMGNMPSNMGNMPSNMGNMPSNMPQNMPTNMGNMPPNMSSFAPSNLNRPYPDTYNNGNYNYRMPPK